MKQANKDVKVLTDMMNRYKQDENATNVVKQLYNAIHAILPSNLEKAHKNSYFKTKQGQLDKTRAEQKGIQQQKQNDIDNRHASIRKGAQNFFSGNYSEPERYQAVGA